MCKRTVSGQCENGANAGNFEENVSMEGGGPRMSAAQQTGWASTAVILPWGGVREGGGDFPPGGWGGWARPPREAYHNIRRGSSTLLQTTKPQKNSKKKKKRIPKDVADRPPWGVMHPRVRITAWKW